MKFIFPGLWIPLFGIGAITAFISWAEGLPTPSPWIFLLFWIGGTTRRID